MKNSKLKGIIYLLITALIWGGSFISQLFGGKAVGSFSFIAYRCVFGCLTIACMILYDNYKRYNKLIFFNENENIKEELKGSTICGFVLFLSMVTQQIGVERTDVAKSGLIAALEVICVPILVMIVFKKKIKLITWIFIITSMFGIMLLSKNSVEGIIFADLIVFISTILYSVTIIQVPMYIDKINPLKFSFLRFVVVGISSFVFSIIFERDFMAFDNIKNALPSILYSGVLASGVAYTFQILGQEYCEPVIATLLMSLEGVFAAVLGWIILGQTLNFAQIIGCIIAIVSIILVQLTDNNDNLINN